MSNAMTSTWHDPMSFSTSWQNSFVKSLKVFTDAGFDIFWTICFASIATIYVLGHSEARILDWLTCFVKISTSLDFASLPWFSSLPLSIKLRQTDDSLQWPIISVFHVYLTLRCYTVADLGLLQHPRWSAL